MFEFETLKSNAMPENIPTVEDIHPSIDLLELVQDSFGNLTAVSQLDDSEHKPLENIDTQLSTEALVDEESNSAMMSNGVKRALQKLQKATGLNFDQPQPKPPPTIMIEGGVCRAFLQGCCYLTLAPLIHLLLNANEDDSFAIEIDSPYLGPNDYITLASAIEHSNAKVYVGIRKIQSMFAMMVLDAANEIHIAPNIHSIGSMGSFAMGSFLDMAATTEAFSAHEEYVHEIMMDSGFLTEDELEEITVKGRSVSFTTEELRSRISKN